MSDRHRTITVVLDQDYREDDVQPILAAVRQVRGVEAASLGTPVDIVDHTNRTLVRIKLINKLYEVLK